MLPLRRNAHRRLRSGLERSHCRYQTCQPLTGRRVPRAGAGMIISGGPGSAGTPGPRRAWPLRRSPSGEFPSEAPAACCVCSLGGTRAHPRSCRVHGQRGRGAGQDLSRTRGERARSNAFGRAVFAGGQERSAVLLARARCGCAVRAPPMGGAAPGHHHTVRYTKLNGSRSIPEARPRLPCARASRASCDDPAAVAR